MFQVLKDITANQEYLTQKLSFKIGKIKNLPNKQKMEFITTRLALQKVKKTSSLNKRLSLVPGNVKI